MSVVVLQRSWCSLFVTFRLVVTSGPVYRAPFLPINSCILGSCLDLGRFLALLLCFSSYIGFVLRFPAVAVYSALAF